MGQRIASFSDLKVKILAAGVAAAVAAGLVACAGGPTRGADTTGIDWGKVPATKLVLFYPGKSSYEWLRNPAAHKGAASETARGDSCVSCHDDAKEEQRQGARDEPHGALRSSTSSTTSGSGAGAAGSGAGASRSPAAIPPSSCRPTASAAKPAMTRISPVCAGTR